MFTTHRITRTNFSQAGDGIENDFVHYFFKGNFGVALVIEGSRNYQLIKEKENVLQAKKLRYSQELPMASPSPVVPIKM